jgi:hypothetical protein
MTKLLEQRDIKAQEVVGFQVDYRNRVWVCIDGQCVLRVVGAKHVEIMDDRRGALSATVTVGDAEIPQP